MSNTTAITALYIADYDGLLVAAAHHDDGTVDGQWGDFWSLAEATAAAKAAGLEVFEPTDEDRWTFEGDGEGTLVAVAR